MFLDDRHANSFQTPDLEDVRESVRQGVTKVAGKLSSLANGVMSSLQVSLLHSRYIRRLLIVYILFIFRTNMVTSI